MPKKTSRPIEKYFIPYRCRSRKVANSSYFEWWCRYVCGRTKGKLCDPWCRVVERFGMWTLGFTLFLPLILIFAGFIYLII